MFAPAPKFAERGPGPSFVAKRPGSLTVLRQALHSLSDDEGFTRSEGDRVLIHCFADRRGPSHPSSLGRMEWILAGLGVCFKQVESPPQDSLLQTVALSRGPEPDPPPPPLSAQCRNAGQEIAHENKNGASMISLRFARISWIGAGPATGGAFGAAPGALSASKGGGGEAPSADPRQPRGPPRRIRLARLAGHRLDMC
ncbi:unnamed protein product [Prorocentrum cordatum]|uniref:Uncharacterized protein n=1 Tax=Prorocentrum cordatum TaxID=2364126 RepID=A0ABN9QXE0_9DINO|nr:unnamed protein product [Polarella glacialis]